MWVVVVKHNFVRFFEAFDHENPWFYFLYEMPVSLLPWSLLLPFAVWHFKRTWHARSDADRHSLAFAASVVCVTVGFFSLSSSKRDYYMLPLMPWAAYILASYAWEAICAATGEGEAPCDEREFLRRFRTARLGRVMAVSLGLMVFAMAAFSGIAAHFMNGRKSWRPVAEAIDASVSDDDRLVIIDNDNLRMFFYLKSSFALYDDTPEDLDRVLALLQDGHSLDMVLEEDDLKHLAHFSDIPLYVERVIPSRRDNFYVVTNKARPGLQRLPVRKRAA
jgi:hypothetical protein